jgi:uncharacterized protein (DUF305 family)
LIILRQHCCQEKAAEKGVRFELQRGKDPQMRTMAETIIAAQEAEIAELKKWQQEHGL